MAATGVSFSVMKSAYISLSPRGLHYETNLWEIMGCESYDVVTFDFGPLLQGQTRIDKLISACTCLLLKNAVFL